MTRCSCCFDIIQPKGVIHPLWPNLPICRKCSVTAPSCIACERKIKTEESTLEFCSICRSLRPVESKHHAESCFWTALYFLEKKFHLPILVTLRMSSSPHRQKDFIKKKDETNMSSSTIYSMNKETTLEQPEDPLQQKNTIGNNKDYCLHDLLLPEIDALPSHLIGEPHIDRNGIISDKVYGRCDMKFTRNQYKRGGRRPISNSQFEEEMEDSSCRLPYIQGIYCLHGLPEILFIAHMAHELMHAYIFLHRYVLDPVIEECLCNAISIQYLKAAIRAHDISKIKRCRHEIKNHARVSSCNAEIEIANFMIKQIIYQSNDDDASRQLSKLLSRNFEITSLIQYFAMSDQSLTALTNQQKERMHSINEEEVHKGLYI